MKRLPVCILLLSVGILIPVFAETAEELKKVPLVDLVAEANAQIEDLETWTESGERYKEKEDDIRRAAGVLAVLGQAIQEHPQGKSPKLAPLDLRDASLALGKTKEHQAAVAALKNIQAAANGNAAKSEAKKVAWKDLISMDDLMHVVNTRNAKIRRSARRSRDPEGDSRNALTIAMLSIVMAEQGEDYLSEEAEIQAWKKYSQDYGKGMADLAAAFKAKDKAGIQKHLEFATKACNDCHAQFRDAE